MFGTDAAVFIADFGEPVAWTDSVSGVTRSGLMIIDQPDADVQGGQTISREYEVTFETAVWPGLRRGELLVTPLGTLKLRTEPMQKDDRVFSCVKLSRP